MKIDEAVQTAFVDELQKIAAGMVRLGSMPQSAATVAKKTQFLGSVRKSFRPKNFMKFGSSMKALALGAGTVLGTAGGVAAVKAKRTLDEERLNRMRRVP